MRVAVDRDVVLEADVEALEVLAHQHEVDVVVASAGNERARRAHVGVELELLAQPHVDRPEAAADRRGERSLEREPRAPDAVEQRRRQRIAASLRSPPCRPAGCPSRTARPQRVEDLDDRGGDLGADAVAGNERGRDLPALSSHVHLPGMLRCISMPLRRRRAVVSCESARRGPRQMPSCRASRRDRAVRVAGAAMQLVDRRVDRRAGARERVPPVRCARASRAASPPTGSATPDSPCPGRRCPAPSRAAPAPCHACRPR